MLIGIYFLVLIAMNFFVALPTICSKLNYQKVENSENIEYVSEEKPNVYFLYVMNMLGRGAGTVL